MMSVSGISSGLQTDDIISKIMEYARAPQNKLQSDKAAANLRLTAWQDINTRVLALRLKANSIADAADFQAMTVTSSNDDILTGSASSSASPGSYYITVTSRAQCHQVASQAGAYASVNDVVGTGDVSITLADGTAFTVTLNSNNNTLSGLRDAINKADKGVKASIVNSGTSSTPDYRLVLTSQSSGTAHRMTTIVTSGLSGGTAPGFDLIDPVQAAADAIIEVGEGAGKITVTKDSNIITDFIPGLTINIASADAGEAVRVDVVRDTEAIKTAIRNFVTQYNDLADAIDAQFDYDTQTGKSGSLMGDYQLQNVQMQIESALSSVVAGLSGNYTSLPSVGITQDTGGHLVIDDSQLSRALESDPDGVTRLFSAGMDSDSSYITFLSATSATQPSGSAGWLVHITQAARRAQVTSAGAFSHALDASETVTVNGKAILLTAGTTIDDAIVEINRYSAQTGVMALRTAADGTGTGDYLTFRRTQYGSAYTISVVSNRSAASGYNTGVGNELITEVDFDGEIGTGQGMAGLDVAGTIDGEVATGKGQTLSLKSTTSTSSANGISISCTALTAMDPVKVIYTKGVGATLRDLLSDMTSVGGAIASAQSGINDLISDLDDSIADMETRLADQETRLYTQFNAMEAQLAKLQQQGNYLAAQLSALNK